MVAYWQLNRDDLGEFLSCSAGGDFDESLPVYLPVEPRSRARAIEMIIEVLNASGIVPIPSTASSSLRLKTRTETDGTSPDRQSGRPGSTPGVRTRRMATRRRSR